MTEHKGRRAGSKKGAGKRGRDRPVETWIQSSRDYTRLTAIDAVTPTQEWTDWKKQSWGFDSAPTDLVDCALEQEES